MRALFKFRRCLKVILITGAVGVLPIGNGCFDSSIVKRFREAYEPGLVAGLSAAVTDPANSQIGFRQTATALFEALGAIIQPRTP